MAQEKLSIRKFSPLTRFWRLLAAERKDIISIYLFAIVAGIISLSLPLGIQAIFNYVAVGEVTTSWVVLISVVIVGVLANGLVQIFQISITERLQQRIFTNSALEFSYRIPRLKMEALRKHVAPELVNRFFDTLTVQKSLSKILMDLSASSLQILFGLLLLSFYHPFFILFSVVLLGLLLLMIRITGPSGLRTSLEESKYKYKVAFWLEEMARTLESFKLAGSTSLPLRKTDGLLTKYLSARNKHFKVLLLNYGMILGFKVLIIGSMLLIGSLLVFDNQLNVGQFVAMEIVVILLLNAVDKLILAAEHAYDILTALEKIGSLTDMPLESELGEDIPRKSTENGLSISAKSLTLQFPDMRYPIIDNVNLELKAGECINIVTTDDSFVTHFFRMLTGFYEGYDGSLTFNSLPLQNVRLEDLRNQTGGYSTLQEIFDGTLLQNITVGGEGITIQRILEIIDAVGLNEFVEGEKHGLSTMLHTGGGNLPESIFRKIILARCIAKHPTLLLLNRPFEGLEKVEKTKFIHYLRQKMPMATVILASSQPESDLSFDKSYVVKVHSLVPLETKSN